MEPLYRYGLDLTGQNHDNFVANESHTLSTRRNRAVVPKAGAFFGESLVMIDNKNSRILVRGIDYVHVELNQILSIKTGKDIFGATLVINREISSDIKISYSCVGGPHGQSVQAIFDLLEKIPDNSLDFSWYEVDNKPLEFSPTPHFHPIGEASGFEEICHATDKIHKALVYTDLPVFKKMVGYIQNIFVEIDQKNKYKMDAFFGPELTSFKKQITAALYEVDKVENNILATEEDGRIAARADSISKNFIRTKYIAINALIAFKNVLYTNFVKTTTTDIGLTVVRNVSPDVESILELNTGSVRTLVSLSDAEATDLAVNLSVYPDDVARTSTFVIMRISANSQDRGGIFFLMESTGKSFYILHHIGGDSSSRFNSLRLATEADLEELSSLLQRHLVNTDNSHAVTPSQIGLGLVEDQSVVTMQEILCLDTSRKYITFDLFLLFMKTFMIGKSDGDVEDRNGTINPLEDLDIHTCVSSILKAEEVEDCVTCETC